MIELEQGLAEQDVAEKDLAENNFPSCESERAELGDVLEHQLEFPVIGSPPLREASGDSRKGLMDSEFGLPALAEFTVASEADYTFTEAAPVGLDPLAEELAPVVSRLARAGGDSVEQSEELGGFSGALGVTPVVTDQLLAQVRSIPQTMGFKIGDAADLVGVKQYVLRYWETEFAELRPKKSRNGQRIYSRRDVETAILIKKLLYEDRFSIEGARGALRSLRTQVREEKAWSQQIDQLEGVKSSAAQDLRRLVERLKALRQRVRDALSP